MKNVIFCLAMIFLCACCTGAGYIFGGSNLGFGGYPDFSELGPSKPWNNDEYSARRYQREVKEYVEKAKEYVENAENDKKRINNSIEDAIQKADEVVEDYNRWVRNPY